MVTLAALQLLVWAVPVAAQDDLGLWQSAAALGDGDTEATLERTDAISEVLRGVSAGVRTDPSSLQLMQDVRDATIEMNLGQLYDMLPEREAVEHWLLGHGRSLGVVGYQATLFPTATDRGRPRGLLGYDTELRMEPAEHDLGGGQGYAVRQSADVGMGPIAHDEVALAAEAFLRALVAAADADATPSRMTAARRLQPGLDGEIDLLLVAAMAEALPELTRTLSRFVVVEQMAQLRGDMLAIDGRFRIDQAELRGAGYTALGKQLDRMNQLLTVTIGVRDPHGHELASVRFRSGDSSVDVVATTRDGGFVPRTAGGQVVSDHLVRPTDDAIDIRLRIDTEVRAEGILLKITGYELPIVYRSADGGASVALDIKSQPTVEFTGTNKVSAFLAELADSALNLEAHGQVVFKAVAAGTDGDGTKARLHYVDGEAASISTSLDMLLVDNALVRFGMRLAGRHLAPSDEAVADGMRLVSKLIDELEEDYRAVRPRLASR